MPPDQAVHALAPKMFGAQESVIATADGMTATAFRYSTDVEALRIRNTVGEVVLLPFQGQQVWDATFLGRRLTMRSMFDEPYPTTAYLATYGAFFIHCGASAMGNPSPADTHPLHGELPNARYLDAALVVGSENGRACMELTGTYRHLVAFSLGYEARPVLRLDASGSSLRLDLAIRNLRHAPMELMYLAHINFRPIDGGRLVDAVPDDAAHIAVRTSLPPQFTPTADYLAFRDAVRADPARHRVMEPGRRIDPELVMTLACPAGPDGWARALQIHPDGTADFLMHRPDELGRAVRWIARTGDEDALGLVLPATAGPDGYAAARAAGDLRIVPPLGTFRCRLVFGALSPAEAMDMEAAIAAQRGRA